MKFKYLPLLVLLKPIAFWGSVFLWILVLRANNAYYHTLVTMSVDTFVMQSHVNIKKQIDLWWCSHACCFIVNMSIHFLLKILCIDELSPNLSSEHLCNKHDLTWQITVLFIICGKSVTFSTQFLGRTYLQWKSLLMEKKMCTKNTFLIYCYYYIV